MKIYKLTLIVLLAIFIGACNTATEPKKEDNANNANAEKTDETKKTDEKETTSAKIESPTAAIEAFVAGIRAEDEVAIKNTLSEKSSKMLDLRAKVTGKNFFESLAVTDKDSEMKEMPEMRNEKIEGDTATLEVKGKKDKDWDTVPFIKENGSWKIAQLDKEYDEGYEKMSKEAEKMAEKKDGKDAGNSDK